MASSEEDASSDSDRSLNPQEVRELEEREAREERERCAAERQRRREREMREEEEHHERAAREQERRRRSVSAGHSWSSTYPSPCVDFQLAQLSQFSAKTKKKNGLSHQEVKRV